MEGTIEDMPEGKKKKYWTVIEIAWKIVAPLVVAVAKTLIENGVR